MGRTHYDVLGITPDASTTLIRAAYRARIRETHPDNGGSEDEAAQVNEALNVLSNESTRAEYDRSIAPPQHRPAEPAPTPPPTAAPSAHFEPAPFRPTGAKRLPLWRRGRTGRILLITGAAWCLAAIVLGVLAAARADSLGVAQPAIAGSLTGALPALIIVIVLTRAKLWLIAASILGYSLFAGSQSVSGYGTAMLIVTFVVCLVMRLSLRFARKDAALEAAGDFWAAAAHPELGGWFISRSLPDRQTCLVQLVDVTGRGRPDTSAMLWGHHSPGSYIITDLSMSPAHVLLTVTRAEMVQAKKARR